MTFRDWNNPNGNGPFGGFPFGGFPFGGGGQREPDGDDPSSMPMPKIGFNLSKRTVILLALLMAVVVGLPLIKN